MDRFVYLLLCFIPAFLPAQSPEAIWGKRLSVSNPIFSFGKNLAIVDMDYDADGFLYAVGFNRATLLDGGSPVHGPYSGAQTGFVLKMDTDGEILWHRRLTMGVMKALDVEGGALYVAGDVASAEYGPLQLEADGTGTVTTIFANGYYDGFVARYSLAGELSWARTFGGADDDDVFEKGDRIEDLAVSSSGQVYITGSYFKQFRVAGELVFEETSDRGKTFFLAALDGAGALVWARDIKSPLPTDGGNAEGLHLAATAQGAAVAIAYSPGGLLINGEILLNDNGGGDRGALLAHYSTAGSLLWHRNLEPELGLMVPLGLGTASDGQIVVAFAHERQVLIDEAEELEYLQQEDGLLKTGLAAFNGSGQLLWAKSIFASDASISVHPDGDIFLGAAAFRTGVQLGNGIALDFPGDGAVSLWARFSKGGEALWAHRPGLLAAAPFSTNHFVLASLDKQLYAAANFNTTLDFGGNIILDNGYESPDFDAFYVVRIDDSNLNALPLATVQPLRVYPNPVRGAVWADLPEGMALRLYRLDGQLVWAGQALAGQQRLEFGPQVPGLYFLKGQGRSGAYLQPLSLVR